MKNIYLSLVLLVFIQQVQAQIINIPDVNFKNALINTLCADTNGDGVFNSDADTNNDNEIQVSEAEAVLRLKVASLNITSLEGIEKFTNLIDLYCEFNQITTLDISHNPNLMNFWCYTNQLISLNLGNGNNEFLLTMYAQGNSNLTCIEVDDVEFANNAFAWSKDATSIYSENCGVLGIDDVENERQVIYYPNPVNNILRIQTPNAIEINAIKVYDVLGKLVMEEKSHFKQLDLSNLSKGLFLVIIQTDNNSFTKRIVKK